MNCFDINQNTIHTGIAVERLDGVLVGDLLIPFHSESQPRLAQMIVNGLLCDANLAEGKLIYEDSQENDSLLVRLRTSTDNHGEPSAAIEHTGIQIIKSRQYASDVIGGGIEIGGDFSWRVNVQLFFVIKPGHSVTVTWSRQPKKPGWFARRVGARVDEQPLQILRTRVELLNGRPVVIN